MGLRKQDLFRVDQTVTNSLYIPVPDKIQFEISSMCNALCLGCVRTDTRTFNNPKSKVPKKQLVSISTVVELLTSKSMSTVTNIEFCGTIDEPMMHPDFLEMLEAINNINPGFYRVVIHTNAGVRSTDDWTRLAVILNKFKSHSVKFGIDGLEDTHAIYRQNTDFNKIIDNAKAFIAANGNAEWQYLIFPWNSHQVDTARELSKEYKFKLFIERYDRSDATKIGLEKIEALKKTATKPQTANIMRPLDDYIKNQKNEPIDCYYKTHNMYFVSHDSKLWPCCFIANGFFSLNSSASEFLNKRIFEHYGDDFNDLTEHSVEEILASDFYTSDLVDSWMHQVGLGKKDKVSRCAETCGVKQLAQLPIGKFQITDTTQQ